jgi:hypothetical protein
MKGDIEVEYIKRVEAKKIKLPGRFVQQIVGEKDIIKSKQMTVGFATFSQEAGPMEPHHHIEETIYIVSANKGIVRYGEEKDKLYNMLELEEGMILHFEELEWHVFEFEENGYVDILFIFGQVGDVRSEKIDS